MSTIRRQVVLASVQVSLATLAVLVVLNGYEQRAQVRRAVDQRLDSHVFLMTSLLRVADYHTLQDAVTAAAGDESILSVRVQTADGNLITESMSMRSREGGGELREFVATSANRHDHVVGRVRFRVDYGVGAGISASPWVLVPAGLAFALIAWLLSRRLTEHVARPLRAVFDTIRDSDGRSWPLRDPGGPVEIRQLNSALEEMVEANARHTQALDEANEALQEQLRVNEETQGALLRAQKLESIGRLAGGIAHDFNNLLAVVLANLEVAEEQAMSPQLRAAIDASIQAAMRGANLTSSMLSFAQRSRLQPEPLLLEEMLGQIESIVHRTIPTNIELKFDSDPDLHSVLADRSSAENALLNLIVNARDAIVGNGTISVSARNVHVHGGQFDVVGEGIPEGDYVRLRVEDSGSGIEKAVLQQIFEPFFTTKDTDKGTGLGLSMVFGFISQSGGHITVETEVGAGTSISIYLPVHVLAEPVGEVVREAPVIVDSSQVRVLFVEDEPEVRAALSQLLENGGFEVLQAEDGQGGLDLLDQRSDIDLVITDMIMPGSVQGADIAHWLHTRRPDVPLLILSGNPHENDADLYATPKVSRFLSKPVRFRVLLESIAELLELAREGAQGGEPPSGEMHPQGSNV